MTLSEMRFCDLTSATIEQYRARHPIDSPCWTDEWVFGYLCSLRDQGLLTPEQWTILVNIYRDVSNEIVEEDLKRWRRR